ncbi:MAG: 3-phosphoshikimate 1-carboxyvinyltransferase [Thermoguttaceae bacterium]|nr:3-phosphoshikimate 1-carboxyvinyltransferase [Thermoguttaceae bacterium]MDW8038605.1 3-phosphoshikimate 1-carboxyvinyltransferase [Thermoguttaceae bacterium]
MMDKLLIQPSGPVRGTIRPPGSKSITNRALVCSALATGQSILEGALASEDTQVMIESLGRLGISVQVQEEGRRLVVQGQAGQIPAQQADLYTANSGTTIRFLTAMVSLGRGIYRLDGVERMRQRPIGDLLEALAQLGVDARSEQNNGCPPVLVHAHGLPGGRAEVAGQISSQFLSALLMAAPCAQKPVEIVVRGPLVSRPYVDMTLAVMRSFGAHAEEAEPGRFLVQPTGYRACQYQIEPDASAASYFFGAAAITGGQVTVEGLGRHSLQGDVAFCQCLQQMGCQVVYGQNCITVSGRAQRGIDVDMNPISDTVPTLAAVALLAQGPTRIRGVAHMRHKETDRLAALATELRKLGASIEELPDGLLIQPGPLHGAEIETYNDHRMAMSLALVGLVVPGVVIRNPGCTVKTYPAFFEDLAKIISKTPP